MQPEVLLELLDASREGGGGTKGKDTSRVLFDFREQDMLQFYVTAGLQESTALLHLAPPSPHT